MVKVYTVQGVNVQVAGQYLPSEAELSSYVTTAKEKLGDELTGVVVSCGPEYVSAYFCKGEEKQFYRCRRLINCTSK